MAEAPTQTYSMPALQDLCAILSDMLPNLPGIIYRCRNNQSWTMLDLAEPVRELTGYGPEALIEDAEVAYADLIHPEDRDRVWEEVQKALDEGKPFRTSYRIRTRSDEVRRVWEQGRRAASPDGSDEIMGFIQDVTDWEKKWEQLERTAQLLEQTIGSLEEAVIVIDTSGEGRGILSVNPAAVEMFGYEEDELVGGTTEKLHVDRRTFEDFARETEPILEREGVVHAAFALKRKDGTEFAAEQTVTLLDPEEGIAGGAVSVVRDVSHRHALEEQLRRAQRLEAVGRLAGGVAHDFNNLLTVIRAHTDFALMELPEAHALMEEIQAIQNAASRAADLTRQLLAFSREQVLQPRVVDMNRVVERSRRLLERVIGETIEVRTKLYPEPLPVEADPAQLEQALVNLAVNARDAMPEGGILTIGTALETGPLGSGSTLDLDDALVSGPRVRLVVADTGVGMDDATISRIFEPFFTTKGQGEGTGLGLATTYGFVAQSGGVIDVESEPGEGTVFILRFPRPDAEPEPLDGEKETRQASLGGCRLLVVEDDPNVLRVIEKALDRAGCEIRTAQTGEAAIDLLGREPEAFDLVLTDMVLPGVSGQHIVDRVLELDEPLPVIVMSGYAADSPGHTASLPAGIGFLPKPFTPSQLVDRIREELARG
ncbi:MAG: PAS domain S-box protein [Longimicrobiales bacterium]|nr:PAS domain S-box protein [Longimicrobiales bacterium]